jgi:hypothetical protein
MNILKTIFFGISAGGENIIDKQPGFRSYYPENQVEFNSWSYLMKVGSRVEKNTKISPWYKERQS